MQGQGFISHRTITAYNRLSRELAALNHVLRERKPAGVAGMSSIANLNEIIANANRLFRREPDLPQFAALDPAQPLTVVDFAVLITRLSAAAVAFEERYAKASSQPPPRPTLA